MYVLWKYFFFLLTFETTTEKNISEAKTFLVVWEFGRSFSSGNDTIGKQNIPFLASSNFSFLSPVHIQTPISNNKKKKILKTDTGIGNEEDAKVI